MPTYIIAGSKPWNRQVFDEVIKHYPGTWHYVGDRSKLTLEWVEAIRPTLIFFLHWSWKVEVSITGKYNCVCFHMTDVPYGRGGSPLQNLIIRGHSSTKLTALRMEESFDAGPVYCKEDLSLAGSAEEIYIRATYLAAAMIQKITENPIEPVPQQGEAVIFKRRLPKESEVTELASMKAFFDFIRMLDAEGYPRAFLDYNGFRCEFRNAVLCNGWIEADVTIKPTPKGHCEGTSRSCTPG